MARAAARQNQCHEGGPAPGGAPALLAGLRRRRALPLRPSAALEPCPLSQHCVRPLHIEAQTKPGRRGLGPSEPRPFFSVCTAPPGAGPFGAGLLKQPGSLGQAPSSLAGGSMAKAWL
jgi:hypothetical protein